MPDPIPAAKAAEWFLTQGFRAFPVWGVTDHGTCRCPLAAACTSPGKHPATGKGGFHDATDDIAKVKTFLANPGTSNYGLVCPPGVIAVDVDGEDGKAKWDELQKAHGPLPATLTVVTANGWHFFFTVDDERIGKHLFGFITRSQDKGYTLGPGSHHASGVVYGMANGKGGIQPLPDKWVDGLTKPKTSNLSNATIKVGGPPDPSSIAEGSRHDYLRDRARTLRGGGLTGEALLNAVMALNAQLPSPKTQEEVERAIGDVETKFDPDPIRLEALPDPVPDTPVDEDEYTRLTAGKVWASQAVPSPMASEWLVEGLLRPKGIAVLAGEEGLGKSIVANELAVRLATGHGALFGKYPINGKHAVLLFDEENGPDIQYEREDDIVQALGLTRLDMGGNYGRYSFVGTRLDDAEGRHAFEVRVDDFVPRLVIIDTGSMVMDDEHGATFRRVIQYVRKVCEAYNLAVLFLVHLVKPERDEKSRARGAKQGRGITEVMGHWARVADSVWLMNAADDGKAIWTVSKRWGSSRYVIERADGVWRVAATLDEAKAITINQNDTAILAALKTIPMTGDEMVVWLGKTPQAISRPTVFRRYDAMERAGLIVRAEGVASLTPAGEVVLGSRLKEGVRLVLSQPQ